MKKLLSQQGWYVFMIPVFFVFHGYVQNFGLITAKDCLLLTGIYLAAVSILYFIFCLVFSNKLKAAVAAAFLISFFLFFGAIVDFFKTHLFLFSRYSVLLPAFLLLFFGLIFYLKKTTATVAKPTLLLNALLIIYILVDAGSATWKGLNPSSDRLSIYHSTEKINYKPCDTCANPDIYFLLFDEYTSTVNLQQTFNYNNAGLDSFLLNTGFRVLPHSYSNYNFTPFSMASILNMDYISGIKNTNACTIQDYANCNNLIRNNEVIRFLSSRQYDIVNYSIFDLAGNPSMATSSLLPVKTRLITAQTFYYRMMKDIGWNLYTGRFAIKALAKNMLYENLHNNTMFIEKIKGESALQNKKPRFIYAHFEMPHPPFYFDEQGNARNEEELIKEQNGEHVQSYKNYLPYTNTKLKQLVSTIQQNTGGNAVIIIMGDHGFRVALNLASKGYYFKNLNAVYFPDKNYGLLKDSTSGVNQFRLIFNALFKQHFRVLKDTAIFLKD